MFLKSGVLCGCQSTIANSGATVVGTVAVVSGIAEMFADIYSDIKTFTHYIPKHLLVDNFGAQQILLLSHPDVHHLFTSVGGQDPIHVTFA